MQETLGKETRREERRDTPRTSSTAEPRTSDLICFFSSDTLTAANHGTQTVH